MVSPQRDHRTVMCPDCDAELDQVGAWTETRLRPAELWRCPGCGARWVRDYSGMLTEL